jgi:hypothetical protein
MLAVSSGESDTKDSGVMGRVGKLGRSEGALAI